VSAADAPVGTETLAVQWVKLRAGNVHAAVLDSAGYPSQLADLAAQVKAPILMLQGTADSPADAGSALTNVQRARDFEAALRRVGKPVDC